MTEPEKRKPRPARWGARLERVEDGKFVTVVGEYPPEFIKWAKTLGAPAWDQLGNAAIMLRPIWFRKPSRKESGKVDHGRCVGFTVKLDDLEKWWKMEVVVGLLDLNGEPRVYLR